MWPAKVDLTKNECRGYLRHLELNAYSHVIDTFRAQGSLDTGKSNVLEQLRKVLHITQDRHKAEARRVANDEKLKTIAESLNGKSFDLEWNKEGHRTYPLIARTPPSTALKNVADQASIETTHENSALPHPHETKRGKTLDEDAGTTKPIITNDPTLPPPSLSIVGLSKKDMKKSLLDSMASSNKKRGNLLQQYKYSLPAPNMKIRQLYNTFQGKKQRKAHKKQSKKSAKYGMQSPPAQLPSVPLPGMPGTSKSAASNMNPRMIHSYASPSLDEKLFESAELQKHLTMLPPPPPASSSSQMVTSYQPQYIPVLPTSKKDVASNLIKMNSQHYPQQLETPPPMRNANQKNAKKMAAYSGETEILHNQLKSPKRRTNTSFDHIPDPTIIFSTTSSKSVPQDPPNLNNVQNPIDPVNLDVQTSSLQLLSQAASAIPKIKITPQMQVKTMPSKGQFKIIPTSTIPGQKLIFKPLDPNLKKASGHFGPITSIPKISVTSSNKMQKVQLVMNSQSGGPAKPMIITGKATNNSQNNVYTIGGKGVDANNKKVIVQSIEKYVPFENVGSAGSAASAGGSAGGQENPNSEKIVVLKVNHENQYNIIDNQISSVVPRTPGGDPDYQNSPIITEDTPIDILPAIPTTQTPIQTTNFPKIQLSNFLKTTGGGSKQIKLLPLSGQNIKIAGINISKLGNRIQIPKNLINAKSVTILPQQTSQPVLQGPIVTSCETIVPAPTATVKDGTGKKSETSSTDWEQELDDVNRVKNVRPAGKGGTKTNHPAGANTKAIKKIRLVDEAEPQTSVDGEKPNGVNEGQEKSETSETNNNVYDVSNLSDLVIYDQSMNSNENIIIENLENLENIVTESESVQDEDHQKVFDGETQIIIVNPEEHQQLLDEQAEENQKQSREDNHEKINGQFIEVAADGEELTSGNFMYQELVKSLHDDVEFEEIPRISEEHDGKQDVSRPLADTNSFDEFMAASKLISSDIVGSDGDEFSESTSSSTMNASLAQQTITPKLQSIE